MNMFEDFYEQHVRNTSHDLKRHADQVRTRRAHHIMYHGLYLIIGMLCFLIMFVGFLLAKHYPSLHFLFKEGSILVALMMFIICVIDRRRATTLSGFIKHWQQAIDWWNKRNQDFLWVQGWSIKIIFILACIFGIWFLWGPLNYLFIHNISWNSALEKSDSFKGVLDKFLTASFTILGIQVGFFSFLFGQLLGKYSHWIVRAVMEHPAVRYAFYLALVNLFIPIVVMLGIQQNQQPYLTLGLIISNMACFLLSLSITKTGIHAESAIAYAALRFSEEIKQKIKTPISSTDKYIKFWNALLFLGLDWRDPQRFVAIGQPYGGEYVEHRLTIFFGIAGKAIQDNQRDILNASLRAIIKVSGAYIDRRKMYYDVDDRIFSYLNDQSSALIKMSSNSKNEYLVTDIASFIGIIGLYTLEIGDLLGDRNNDEEAKIARSRQTNPFVYRWMRLLEEVFDQTCELQRSTAPNRCINLITQIALKAHEKEWPITLISFLSVMKSIYKKCMSKAGDYEISLATLCIQSILTVWHRTVVKPSEINGQSDFHHEACKTIEYVTKSWFVIIGRRFVGLNSATVIINKKLTNHYCSLTDIFYGYGITEYKQDWERQAVIQKLEKLINLVIDLGQEAVIKNDIHPVYYLETLYDFAFLVLRGLPESLTKNHSVSQHNSYSQPPLSNQENCDAHILNAINGYFKFFCGNQKFINGEPESKFLGMIGLAVIAYRNRGGTHIKDGVLEIIQDYYDYMKTVIQTMNTGTKTMMPLDKNFDALQLIGAWLKAFLYEQPLGDEIAQFIAHNRPFDQRAFIGSSTQYGYMGYPTVGWSDFQLPTPDGVKRYLTEEETDLDQANAQLICDTVLIPYYESIKNIRAPIAEKYYERARANRERVEKERRNRKLSVDLTPDLDLPPEN